MPLYRRLPKRGFTNPSRKEFAEINLGALQRAIERKRLDPAGPLDEAALQSAGLFKRRRDGVRLLAGGNLSIKVTLHITGATRAAIAAVEKGGGTVVLLGGPPNKSTGGKGKGSGPTPEAKGPPPGAPDAPA
jgi:large subunit ribosomal protein L15